MILIAKNILKLRKNQILNVNLSISRLISVFESISNKSKPVKKYQQLKPIIDLKQTTNKKDFNKEQKDVNLPAENVNKFEDEIFLRRQQARNSVMFKIYNKTDLHYLIDDCEKIGSKIVTVFLIDDQVTLTKAVLIEFNSKKCVNNLLDKYGKLFDNDDHLPCTTRLLVYKNSAKIHPVKNSINNINYFKTNVKEEEIKSSISIKQKFSFLSQIEDTDEQIRKFYDHFKIDELGYRIRYFVASIVEESFYSLFSNCFCLPFGSSASNFGHKASDLDLSFALDENLLFNNKNLKKKQILNTLNGRFYFFSKGKDYHDRNLAQEFLELADFIIHKILPRFSVRRLIKDARVPILKFDCELPSGQKLNCDLSMSNVQISFQMTKLFWNYTQMDNRVAPLVFLLKYWAELTKITSPGRPCANITNFQLTVLILNFLLRTNKPLILPLENMLIKQERESQDSDLNYLINNDLTIKELKLKLKEINRNSLKDLLIGFFNYYSSFDFDVYAISLSRNLSKKNDFKNKSLVILNPFAPELNASQNVNSINLKKFIDTCKQSYEILQNGLDESTNNFKLADFFHTLSKPNKGNHYEADQKNSLIDEMNK